MDENVVGTTLALAREDITSLVLLYLLFNSSLVYFVNLTNFVVTKHTSALTLQVDDDAIWVAEKVKSTVEFDWRGASPLLEQLELKPKFLKFKAWPGASN